MQSSTRDAQVASKGADGDANKEDCAQTEQSDKPWWWVLPCGVRLWLGGVGQGLQTMIAWAWPQQVASI